MSYPQSWPDIFIVWEEQQELEVMEHLWHYVTMMKLWNWRRWWRRLKILYSSWRWLINWLNLINLWYNHSRRSTKKLLRKRGEKGSLDWQRWNSRSSRTWTSTKKTFTIDQRKLGSSVRNKKRPSENNLKGEQLEISKKLKRLQKQRGRRKSRNTGKNDVYNGIMFNIYMP